MTLLKKKSVFGVSLLLVMTMLISNSARATCYAIDEYMMLDGRRIVCFSDLHYDSFDGAKAEQDVLVALAQEQGAYCIVEDALGYKGNDWHVRSVRDAWLYSALMHVHDRRVGFPMTALFGMSGRCAANGIECHNVECRYANFSYEDAVSTRRSTKALTDLLNAMIEEIEDAFHEVCQNGDMSQQARTALRSRCDRVIADFCYKGGSTNVDNFYRDLFNLKLVAHLKGVLAHEEDKRPIFIFAGGRHISFVDDYLNPRCAIHKSRQIRNSRVQNCLESDVAAMCAMVDPAGKQDEACRIVKKYRVDIRSYFEAEEAAKRELVQQAAKFDIAMAS